MRCVDLSHLPRDARNYISWKQSGGMEIPFEYDGISGTFTIVEVHTGAYGEAKLDICYRDKIITAVPASSVKNGILGRVLGIKRFEFVTQIGDRFTDAKRDYTIVAQRRGALKSNPRYTRREVEILCHKCHAKTWMKEESVLPPRNCACNHCRYAPVSGKKSVAETDPWMIPFFPNGYEEARQYTRGQGTKIRFVCPYCHKTREKAMAISTLSRTHSIGCVCAWSVGRSFPHRLMKSVLECLDIAYIQEARSCDLKWALRFSYDFYLPDFSILIEAHGKQHYEQGTGYYRNTLEETQKNDDRKRSLALENGIAAEKYIVINCRKSETEYIKNSILQSGLPELLGADFGGLDWLELTQRAWKSEKLEILAYCKQYPQVSVREIAECFGVSRDLVKEVQVQAGIYNAGKEKELGRKRRRERYRLRTQERDAEICRLKATHPTCSTRDLAELVGMDRHSVCKILKRTGVYDPALEQKNRAFKISAARKRARAEEDGYICQYKAEHPDVSAREMGRLTGHSHGYIIRIWKEHHLYGWD